jgi:hypothetical protein
MAIFAQQKIAQSSISKNPPKVSTIRQSSPNWVEGHRESSLVPVTAEVAHNYGQISVHPKSYETFVQAKLTIGSPGDSHEQEADHVAEHVVNSTAQGPCACGGECPRCQSQQSNKGGVSLQTKARGPPA